MNMDITVRPIEPQGNLYGFASIAVGGLKIDNFKILTNKDGNLFVGMPSKPDKTSVTGYRNTVFVDEDFKEDFQAAVINKYHEAVEQAQNRAADSKTVPDKKAPDKKTPADKQERIADQKLKAQKEADKHNAALPPKDKGTPTRGDRE